MIKHNENPNYPIAEKVFGKIGAANRVKEIDLLLSELFPLCRSLTGNGVRETLNRLKSITDFNLTEVASGTHCYDWQIPLEWNIESASIRDDRGNLIVDFTNNNLHVVSYSTPVDKIVSYKDLDTHIHSLPELPNAIPYRTTYYNRNWGFCMAHNQRLSLEKNRKYHVKIEAELREGSLTYGDCVVRGNGQEEYLISSYCCHPSLANDSLSGVILWTMLLKDIKKHRNRNSYRFVIAPETIGAIAYLSQHEMEMKKIRGGFVLTTVGGPGRFGFKRTFSGDSVIDKVVDQTFDEEGIKALNYPFDISGSDEARYSSPYFRIPIGTISKDKYYEYDYYHTSLDNLDFVKAEAIVETLALYTLAIEKLEFNETYLSLHPYCEPMLGKRGLYPKIGGQIHQKIADSKVHKNRAYSISKSTTINGNELDAIKWVMFYGDGQHTIIDIAMKTGLTVASLARAASILKEYKLVKTI